MTEPTNDAVRRLLREQPEWRPILEACLELARLTGGITAKFVAQRVGHTVRLAPLAQRGILQTVGPPVRGGHRRHYRMPEPEEVEHALRDPLTS